MLAASDPNAYPSAHDEEWAHMMLKELAGYLPAVKPGSLGRRRQQYRLFENRSPEQSFAPALP